MKKFLAVIYFIGITILYLLNAELTFAQWRGLCGQFNAEDNTIPGVGGTDGESWTSRLGYKTVQLPDGSSCRDTTSGTGAYTAGSSADLTFSAFWCRDSSSGECSPGSQDYKDLETADNFSITVPSAGNNTTHDSTFNITDDFYPCGRVQADIGPNPDVTDPATGDNAIMTGHVHETGSNCPGDQPPISFDFSISNGGDKNVQQGSSVTNSISITRSAGTAASVSLSASDQSGSGGVTFSLSSTSCTPSDTCSSTLTINASSTTTTGTRTIRVTGTSGGTTHYTEFILNVTAPPPGCSTPDCSSAGSYCQGYSYNAPNCGSCTGSKTCSTGYTCNSSTTPHSCTKDPSSDTTSCSCGGAGQKCCSTTDSSDSAYYSYSSVCNKNGSLCNSGLKCSNSSSTGKNGTGYCQIDTSQGSCSSTNTCSRADGCSCTRDDQCTSGNCCAGEGCGNDRYTCQPSGSCRGLDGDQTACERASCICAWYTCSNTCQPRGTSNTVACGPQEFTLNTPITSCMGVGNNTQVSLSWTASANAAGYEVKEWNGSIWSWIATITSERSYTHQNLGSSSFHSYIIRAYNRIYDDGWRDVEKYSNSASITTLNCNPPTVDLETRLNDTSSWVVTSLITPLNITAGNSAYLKWSTTNTTSCTGSATHSGTIWADTNWNKSQTVNSNTVTTALPSSSDSYIYTLTCTNTASGASASSTAYIKSDSLPTNPWVQFYGDVHSNTRINLPSAP